jgi:hypothetical protein
VDGRVETEMYPELTLEHIRNPNRLWAIPIVGGTIKAIILIPIFLEMIILGLIYGIVSVINSFVVLFTGKYWQTAYDYILGMVRWMAKVWFYWLGVTNKYPGFDFAIGDEFSLDIDMPDRPSRLLAVPILGGGIRYILTIPYAIWLLIVEYAAMIGALIATIPVLFKGQYPESVYEIVRDFTRLYTASISYYSGFADEYPSFAISWNHRGIKITLIILGVLELLLVIANNIQSATGGSPQ